jgi:ribosomal-protein-alanine N-acetyltransferase
MQLPRLETERLAIEQAAVVHAPLHPPFFACNREHFAPWEPPRPAGVESETYWEEQLAQAEREFTEGRALRFVLFARDAQPQIIGRVNFTQVFRGPFQSCSLGYQIDRAHEGKGLMREALAACIGYAFRERKLHRVQAAYMPENDRSARLLAQLRFETIGIARDYLFINGAWRDHVLTALTNPDFDETAFPGYLG